MKNTLIFLLVLIVLLSSPYNIVLGEELHIQIEKTDIMLPMVPVEFDSLLSMEVVDSYDRNGTVNGIIVFVFENHLNKCNIDRKDQTIDISDFV